MQKVSVIMPCFNHGRFVADSVNSVLSQTHRDLELIIAEDRSSDNSWEVISRLAAKDSRIKAIRHERNQGLSKSRNAALRVASGEFIAFCDSDDLWEPEKLDVQVNLLTTRQDYAVVYCDTLIIDDDGVPTGQCFSKLYPPPKTASGWLFPELAVRNFINIQSVLMRKECLQQVGPFDETIDWIQDWWYWIQLSRHHQFLYLQQPLARYRVHRGSTNVAHRSSYCLNRLKVFRRIVRQYPDLSLRAKADINYEMGVDLCNLRRPRRARPFLWNSARLSMTEARGSSRFFKAAARFVLVTVASKG